MCLLCFRPARLCYCAHVHPVSTTTRIEIVQHPREIFHPLNTARLVERSLDNTHILRGDLCSLRTQVRALPPSSRRFLLFPSADSRDVSELPIAPESVVVLDGTWPMARSLLREIPELQALPHIRLTPNAPSRYRIRRPPSFEALSTLESIALLLSLLEPEVDLDPLTALFEHMIDLNIEARGPSALGSRFKKRVPRPHRFPELLKKSSQGALVLWSEGLRPGGEARRIVGTSVSGQEESPPESGGLEATHLRDVLRKVGPAIFITWQAELRRALLATGRSDIVFLRGAAADYLAHEARSNAAPNVSIPPRPPLGTLEETLLCLGGIEPSGSDVTLRRLRAVADIWRLLLQKSAQT